MPVKTDNNRGKDKTRRSARCSCGPRVGWKQLIRDEALYPPACLWPEGRACWHSFISNCLPSVVLTFHLLAFRHNTLSLDVLECCSFRLSLWRMYCVAEMMLSQWCIRESNNVQFYCKPTTFYLTNFTCICLYSGFILNYLKFCNWSVEVMAVSYSFLHCL